MSRFIILSRLEMWKNCGNLGVEFWVGLEWQSRRIGNWISIGVQVGKGIVTIAEYAPGYQASKRMKLNTKHGLLQW